MKSRFILLIGGLEIDQRLFQSQNCSMETTTEIHEAIERAKKGVRDPDEMRKACEGMDRIREDVKQRVGVVEVAVDLVREARE